MAEADVLATIELLEKSGEADGTIRLGVTKGPDDIWIQGTPGGLRRLAAVLLRASMLTYDEWYATTGPEGRDLEHITRYREALCRLLHPSSRLRFFGVAAFSDVSPEAMQRLSKKTISRLNRKPPSAIWLVAYVVGAAFLAVAFGVGVLNIVGWLWRALF